MVDKESGRIPKRKFSTMAEKGREIIEIDDYPSPVSVKNETPLRAIVCVKNKDHVKNFEKTEECFILDFDPDDSTEVLRITSLNYTESDDSPDLCVLAEKGKVACRDYPHPRHSCAKYAFEKTPHVSHCEQCYCYVCDVAAPCKNWKGAAGHCHAFDNESWNNKRMLMRLADVIPKRKG